MKKDTFVCDKCGQRKRLDRTKRHWCEVCAAKVQIEMRHVTTYRATSAAAAP